MAELESSLTAMDWLPKLSVGGALAGDRNSQEANKVPGGHTALRKAPNSPLDTSATLDNGGGPPRDGKPPYSYANLITFAINSSSKKKMTLAEIYQWICENFPYYKEAGNGWKVNIPTISQIPAHSASFDSSCHLSLPGYASVFNSTCSVCNGMLRLLMSRLINYVEVHVQSLALFYPQCYSTSVLLKVSLSVQVRLHNPELS